MNWLNRILGHRPVEPLDPPATNRELIWWNREPLTRAERNLNRQFIGQGVAVAIVLVIGFLIRVETMSAGKALGGMFSGVVIILVHNFRAKDRMLERKRDAAIADQRIRDRIVAECDRTDPDQLSAPPRPSAPPR